MNPGAPHFSPRILVAPLDWGLGHATRCLPLIRCLLQRGADVWLAGDGKVQKLLQTEYPDLPFLPLPGYAITYGRSRLGTLAALLQQTPKLLHAIRNENKWLQDAMQTHHFDAVISDNRYGLHHPDAVSIFITHQLWIKTPLRLTSRFLQARAYRYINQFNACWVPDHEGLENLAGALSHPKRLPKVPVTYLGPLSRFAPADPVLTHFILILLSGPEPQRTVLENQLLQQAQLFQTPIFIVRGLPGAVGVPKVPYHVAIVNHLPAAVLQTAIDNAHLVVSRCGYSTVMDLMALRKKCIFIPTPMQTEQEYLARHLMQQNRALCISQKKFQLKAAVALAATFPYTFPDVAQTNALETAVDSLLAQCRPND